VRIDGRDGIEQGVRMRRNESFSLGRRVESLRFACQGLAAVARSQHNAWIHGFATFAAVGAGVLLRLGAGEWALLALAVAGVWAAEAFNTAIEALGDAVSPGDHPLVGRAKDAAAGGVLVAAAGAVAIALLVLVPRAVQALAGG
jgi:diacylglycerol kinase (ATP)